MSSRRVTVFHGAVGVQCAQDQVPGERRFNADLGRFLIPHFSDHNHVRIGAKNARMASAKVKSILGCT